MPNLMETPDKLIKKIQFLVNASSGDFVQRKCKKGVR